MRIVTLLGILLWISSCASPKPGTPDPRTQSGISPGIEFRLVVPEGSANSEAIEFQGKTLHLQAPQPFRMSAAYMATDELGHPAIGFEIDSEDSRAFGDWTEAHTGEQVAVVIDGVVLTAPKINERLPGKGIINGGAGGFSAKDLEELLARIAR